MTSLVVEELETTLTQSFSIYVDKRITLAGLRPYIYMHNEPTGTFTFTLKRGGVSIASDSFTSADIKSDLSTSDNYVHIWKFLEFSEVVQLERGDYTLELSHSGYTFAESGYLGWIKEHENLTNEVSGSPLTNFNNPMAFQLFELKDN